MAEQIRSFWSHLCGIFGAILGMIAGGTLVTIERAWAASAHTTCKVPYDSSNYIQSTLSNGAIVKYCYGGGWLCGKVDSPHANLCNGATTCYQASTQFPRYYTFFFGCAAGYYSTEGTAIESLVVSSGEKLTKGMSSLSGVTSTIGQWGNSGGQTCFTHSDVYFSTSTYKIVGSIANSFRGDPYDIEGYYVTPESATIGLCAPCPSYGEYVANSEQFSTNVSSCFMSANTERNDAVEHDGNATGQFIWTQSCMYDASEPETNPWADCEAMNGSGICTMTLDDAGDQRLQVIKIVQSVTGLGLKESRDLVNSAPATIIEDFSCTAANCYKPYFEEKGARVTITEQEIDSGGSDSGTTGGDTTGGDITGLPSCERMKATGDCSVMLNSVGTDKLTVVKIVRSITGLGLVEAKSIVDSAPKMVVEDFSCEAAECYKTIFDANDADVTITEY